MSRERFKARAEDSFFGRFVYDQVIPHDHFLVKLKEIIPWPRFTHKLVKYYRSRAREGRPPYDPALLLRMLLVSYLYDLSERQTEEVANYHLPMKCFIGLAVNEKAPDHYSHFPRFSTPFLGFAFCERGDYNNNERLGEAIVTGCEDWRLDREVLEGLCVGGDGVVSDRGCRVSLDTRHGDGKQDGSFH